jgi:hypothetical protein
MPWSLEMLARYVNRDRLADARQDDFASMCPENSARGRGTSPASGTNRVKGVVHVSVELGEEGVEEFDVELFFLVVRGQAGLADEAWDMIRCYAGKLGTVPGPADAAAIRCSPGFPRGKVSHQCGRRSSHSRNRIGVRTAESR